MIQNRNERTVAWLVLFSAFWVALAGPAMAQPAPSIPALITNLHQLTSAVLAESRLYRDIHLEVTVCAASKPGMGVLVARDETGVEWLQVGSFDHQIVPGERVTLRGWRVLIRKRDCGVELSPGPAIDNDGLHPRRTWGGGASLKAGRNPVRLEWFNYLREMNLETYGVVSNQSVKFPEVYHEAVDESGRTNFVPGLKAECYEGLWERMPDFELLEPAKTGVVSNFDLGFRTRDEMVAIRFTGYIDVPRDGQYAFRVRSDDGSLLFLGQQAIDMSSNGFADVAMPIPMVHGQTMRHATDRYWATVEGRVGFLTRNGKGVEFELKSGENVIAVNIADAERLDTSRLLGSKLRVRGVARPVMTSDQRLVFGRISAIGANDVTIIETPCAPGEAAPALSSVAQVQGLRIEDARRALPVRLKGVVTDARNSAYEKWMSLQDETRGIFVHLAGITNASPAPGQFWEALGHSGAGDFAPVVEAERLTFLGDGHLPEPVRPTWRELVNGSQDVQWAELQGIVTAVSSNVMTLLLPEGALKVQMDRFFEPDLKPFQHAVVRIRGVLYAVWNQATREVRVGTVLMRNGKISVDAPAPLDRFVTAVRKSPRELFLFDPNASAFQRVKVRGQVIYADSRRVFLMDVGAGVRILPADPVQLKAGDLIEAVGYPELNGPSPVLRESFVRKTGSAPLMPPRDVQAADLLNQSLDSLRLRVDATLVALHTEQDTLVLQLEASNRLFFARVPAGGKHDLFQVGSRLVLTGVYVAQDVSRKPGGQVQSFEMLLPSVEDVRVISKPPWWTLQRLLSVVSALVVVLALAGAWIALLRRKVEQRTRQLQHEIRERERAERDHAIEAERSRIARDLHDDLGSSLTEIGVLASTGQRQLHAESPGLFRAIGDKARGLITALDGIVWAVDPEDNSLQSVADYLSGFVDDFLSNSGLAGRFNVPVAFPNVTLDGQVRHGLLMAVKEALNNVVRHAEATEVEFRLAVSDDILEVVIADNGKGFNPEENRDGHGLKNLPVRLTKAGGTCAVKSVSGAGTTVVIRLPLPRIIEAKGAFHALS